MKRKFAALQCMDQNEAIDREEQYEIWYDLERGLLLALRERGTIDTMQYHLAVDGLKRQRMERAGRKSHESCNILPGFHG